MRIGLIHLGLNSVAHYDMVFVIAYRNSQWKFFGDGIMFHSIFGKYYFIPTDTGTFVFRMIDFLFYQLNSNSKNEYLELDPNSDCATLWRFTLFENQKPNNYYIIEKRGVYFDTTHYEYSKAVIDKKYNLKYGSFSVVVR